VYVLAHKIMSWLRAAVYTRAGKLGQSPVDYLEPSASLRRGRGRLGRGQGQRRVQQVANRHYFDLFLRKAKRRSEAEAELKKALE
jgi:hypothetical protein